VAGLTADAETGRKGRASGIGSACAAGRGGVGGGEGVLGGFSAYCIVREVRRFGAVEGCGTKVIETEDGPRASWFADER
jgi:hypothetical protein